MNLIAIFSFLVILYEISSSTISHTPVSTCKSYWILLDQIFESLCNRNMTRSWICPERQSLMKTCLGISFRSDVEFSHQLDDLDLYTMMESFITETDSIDLHPNENAVYFGQIQRSELHKLVPSCVTKSHQRNEANDQIGCGLELVVDLKSVSRKDDASTVKEKYRNRNQDFRNNILAKKFAHPLESRVTFIAVRRMNEKLWVFRIVQLEGSTHLKFSSPPQSLLRDTAFSTSSEAIAIQKNHQTESKLSNKAKVFERNPKKLHESLKQIGITCSNVVTVSSVDCYDNRESEESKSEIPFDQSHEGKKSTRNRSIIAACWGTGCTILLACLLSSLLFGKASADVNVNPLNLVANLGGGVDFIFSMVKPCPFKVFKGKELTDEYTVYNSYNKRSYGGLAGKIAASTPDNKTYFLNFHDLIEQDSSVYTVYVRRAECGHSLEINLTVLKTDLTQVENEQREIITRIGENVTFVSNLSTSCQFKIFKGKVLADEFVVYNSFINKSYRSLTEKILVGNVNETYFINFKNLNKNDSSVYTFYVKDSKNARHGGNFELHLTVLDEANDVFPREVVAPIGGDANIVYRLNTVCPFKIYKGRVLLDEFVVYNSFLNRSYGPMRERIVAVVLNGTYVVRFHQLTEDDTSIYTFYFKDFRNVACGNNVEMNLTVIDTANDEIPREVVAPIGGDANVVYRLNTVCPFKIYEGRVLLDEFVVYNSFLNRSYGPMRERIVAVVLNGTYVVRFHQLTEDDTSIYTFYVKDFRNVACGNNVEMNLTVRDTEETKTEQIIGKTEDFGGIKSDVPYGWLILILIFILVIIAAVLKVSPCRYEQEFPEEFV